MLSLEELREMEGEEYIIPDTELIDAVYAGETGEWHRNRCIAWKCKRRADGTLVVTGVVKGPFICGGVDDCEPSSNLAFFIDPDASNEDVDSAVAEWRALI